MFLTTYLDMHARAEEHLASAFREVADRHGDEPDVFTLFHAFAEQCDGHVKQLQPTLEQYGQHRDDEPERLYSDLFGGTRTGGLALLRDLQDLYLMITEVDIMWIVIKQASQGLQDRDLLTIVESCEGDTTQQLNAIKTRMKQAAPQTLIVAS